MRLLIGAALGAALLSLAGAPAVAAPQDPGAKVERAPSVERFAREATDRIPVEKGYSPRSRRMADCLASFPGYNPRTDRIHLASGATRPCELQVAQASR